MECTKCDGTGFIDFDLIPESVKMRYDATGDPQIVLDYLLSAECDAGICDCCGDGTGWYGEPGVHSESDFGPGGPYASNGGRPNCY